MDQIADTCPAAYNYNESFLGLLKLNFLQSFTNDSNYSQVDLATFPKLPRYLATLELDYCNPRKLSCSKKNSQDFIMISNYVD